MGKDNNNFKGLEFSNNPLTLDELKKVTKPIRNANIVHLEKLSKLDLLALWVTNHVGSMRFFVIILVWTVFWLFWNIFAPMKLKFDPYPAFVFWLFISNMIQLFLLPLIMIGQNLQAKRSEARAEADFEINTRSEMEIETILLHLENQNKMMFKILDDLENKK
ncbi:MAG: DUF1003 domain-containing protein [Candidatus Paceibacterota bacterium]|jgi:uncharacterized membrane protein